MSAHRSQIVIRGGSVFDPSAATIAPATVYIADDRIAGPFEPSRDATVIDASGLLVTPGWVDLHTHIFRGQDISVDPNIIGPTTGVTTMIDTGSAGAHLYDAFVASTLRDAIPRVRAFLNISTIGTTSVLLAGELKQLAYVDVDACIECIERHRDRIIGVKVRASANVGGDNAQEALRRARSVADTVGLPLMVHIGPAPVSYREVLAALGPGDIVTHCFTTHIDTPIADPDDGDALLDAAVQARERGVLFDVGHGGGSFDSRRVAAALRAGFLPDTISSDVFAYADGLIGANVFAFPSVAPADHLTTAQAAVGRGLLARDGLPLVVSKMLALGLGLEDALLRVTINPATAAGLGPLGVGTLAPGAPADVAIFRIDSNPVMLADTNGVEFAGDRLLRPVLTLQGGTAVFDTLSPVGNLIPGSEG